MRAAFEAIPTDKAPPAVKAKQAGEATLPRERETPAAFKAIQAAFKAIPATFKAIPATFRSVPGRAKKRAEAGTVVEGDAYVPVKPPRRPLPVRQLLYALGGGLALVAFVFLAWRLLPHGSPALSVVSDPSGAIVSLNGEQMGETPFEVAILDVSEARLQVTLEGYARVDTFLVFDDDPLALSLVLQRERAPRPATELVVTSMPPGAQVFVDGEPRGQTPLGLDNVGQGPLTVRVERLGYQAWQQDGVLPGQTDTLHAELQPNQLPGENGPPVPDPPPDKDWPPVVEPLCDAAALIEQIMALTTACPSKSDSTERANCFVERDGLSNELDRCTQ